MEAPLVLDAATSASFEITKTQAWVDPTGSATIAQVAGGKGAAFVQEDSAAIHSIGPKAALWLQFRVTRTSAASRDWLIEFPIPLLDAVTLWQRDAAGQWTAQSAGDTLPVAGWPETGRYPFFRLDLAPGQVREFYVQVRHVTPLSLPVRFATQVHHDTRQQLEYLALGVVFGALFFLIVSCAAQSRVYRDRAYAWYAVYAGLTTLAVAAYTGIAAHILWPWSGYWADTSQGCLALLAGSAALLFVRQLAGTNVRQRRMDGVMKTLGLLGIPLAVAYVLVDRQVGLVFLGGYLIVASCMNVVAAALAWRRKDVVGLWMLGAYAPLAASVFLVVLRIFGVIGASWWTQYAVVAAMALEVPLLLIALNIRSRERHGTEIREQALATQDALTGLLSPYLFRDRLRQVLARFRRDRSAAAVVFIDLVNFQHIRASHGQGVAEQNLLRCVIKLRRLLRDVDTIARVGDARFGLIMEGVSARAVVTDRAARLIAAGLMPLPGLKPDVTLQFHIAAILLGEHTSAPDDVTAALAEVLGSMSPRTHRPIRFIDPEPSEAPQTMAPAGDSALPGAAPAG
ncbi:MAG: 7TM diverse intracellular signaling domain-containing protein [Burkholderiaceae bacterium]